MAGDKVGDSRHVATMERRHIRVVGRLVANHCNNRCARAAQWPTTIAGTADFNGRRVGVLGDYQVRRTHACQGVIPANAVLLLGNDPGGSMDATTFGLLDRSNLIGKVRMDGESGGTNDG